MHCRIVNSSYPKPECQSQIEKSQIIIKQQAKEIDLLKQQISDLREVNALLKTKNN
ncbi:hypothetical protein QUF50_05440 [Thiotrichales bacterium HSG1]|nr:hypothetical protein [Thiotrichales bacterium HSG1]